MTLLSNDAGVMGMQRRYHSTAVDGLFLFLLAIIMRVQGATSVLSNFFMWSIQFMGMLFPSVEHAYQFLKARFHGRPDLCQQILKAPTAAAAKQIAKQIQVTNDWNDRRVSHGRPSRPQVPHLSSFPTDNAFIRRLHRPHRTQHLLGDRHRQAWPGTRNVFGLLLARLRNRHQIPDKTRVVVLGHIFISYLKKRIDNGRVSFEDPKEHPGKFHPLFVGLPGATLEMLIRQFGV